MRMDIMFQLLDYLYLIRYRALYFLLFFFQLSDIFAQLNASFVANRLQGCAPLLVVFTNTSTGQPEQCSWDFGNENESLECSPVATFTKPGTYEVVLTIRRGADISTTSKTIRVFEDPVPDFDVNINRGCFPLSVSFTDRSISSDAPITNWIWNLGDGRSSSLQQPTHSYLFSGNFDVTLIVTDANGCRASVLKEDVVSVIPPPVASFSFTDSVACSIPFTARFIDLSRSVQPLTYNWQFGDGATSTEKNPVHQYNMAGNFPVRLEVTNEFGCKDDTTISGSIRVETLLPQIVLGDSLGCAPFTTSYKATANAPIASYDWVFDSEQVSMLPSGEITFTQPGIYPVTLKVISVNGCEATVQSIIRVGTTPQVSFTASPIESCTAPLAVQFTNRSVGGQNFLWAFGTGAVSTEENPSFTYNQLGVYLVRLTVTSAEGCTASRLERELIKIQRPVLTIETPNDGGCLPFTTSFSIGQMGAGNISTVAWDFGNGNTFTGINPPPQSYLLAGNYNVRATVSFLDGCPTQTITRRVSAGGPPTFTATINPREICANNTVTGVVIGGGGAQFRWNMGNGETIEGRNPTYLYRLPGTYTVRVTGSNLGCEVTTNLGQIIVNPPNADFTVSNLCGGLSVRFSNRSDGSVTSVWDFGDGSPPRNSNAVSIDHTFPSFGTYLVKLTVSNPTTGCIDSLIREIVLRNDRPIVSLTERKGCAPYTASFSDTSSNWRTIRWDFDGVVIQGRNVNYTFSQPGAYNVKVYTLDQQGCRDTFLFPQIVKSVKPDAGFSFNPAGGCAPISVNFTDSSQSPFSTINFWQWDFGGLGSSSLQNPTFSFAITDTIPISLFVRDNLGCRDTITNNLPVSFPQARVTAPFNSICTGTPFKFNNNSLGVALSYQWDFGDGSPLSAEQSPAHTYQIEGLYDVKLIVKDDNHCEDSLLLPSFVRVENFSYDFDADNRFRTCPELISNFSISPANILYNQAFWDFGNGFSSLDTSRFPSNIYNSAGIFDVSLMLEDFRGCRDTIIKPQFIRVEGPRGEFTVSPDSGCAPLAVTFQASFTGSTTNFWDFGDGVGFVDTILNTTLTHTYRSPGRARPSLLIDDGLGCVVVVRGPEVRMGNLIAAIEASATVVCNDEVLFLADTGRSRTFAPILSWDWNFGDGITAQGPSVTHAYRTDETRDYWVTVTTTNSFGCTDTDSLLVRAFKNPPLSTDGDKTICLQDQVQLNAGGVAFYEWFPKNTLSDPNSSNPIANPSVTTEYVVLGYDIPSCPAYDTVKVIVVDRIEAIAGPDTTICQGAELQLWARVREIDSGDFIYEWTPQASLIDPDSPFPLARPETDVMYVLKVSNGSCTPVQIPVFVRVAPVPDISVESEVSIFKGQSRRLEVFVHQETSLNWIPNTNITCTDCIAPTVSPTESTVYSVTATSAEGCSVSKEVEVRVVVSCGDAVLQIPNVFTPNNDGINDEFLIIGEGVKALKSLKIFSRAGQMVFESFDINRGWDGTFNGVRLNSGVYVYIVEAICNNDEITLAKGNVTLLR
jgi:gliding motility-associated-like protein